MKRMGFALFLGIVLACFLGYRADLKGSSALKRGDFPGLYSPAVILERGEGERFYEIELHHQIQEESWPGVGDGMYISVYPPFFALFLRPLANLEPIVAKNAWTIFSLAAYLGIFTILFRSSNFSTPNIFFLSIVSLAFVPVFLGVLGGQNTALSMLLYALGARLLESRSRRNDFWAGLIFGLWLFKPQFGLLAGLYLLFERRGSALLGFSASALLAWLLSALAIGVDWLPRWVAATSAFAEINFGINAFQMSSFAGCLWYLSHWGLMSSLLVLPLSLLPCIMLIIWFRRFSDRSVWLLGPLMVLISPQTLFYDLGIAYVSLLNTIQLKTDREINRLLIYILLAGLAFFLRRSIPCLPFFLRSLP